MTHDEFSALLDEPIVVGAIRDAEALSTGELRVLVTHRSVPDALREAKGRFASLGMEKTSQRNAVLIFIAPKSRTFAIVGDVGIHRRAGEEVWFAAAEAMRVAFQAERWTNGVVDAIKHVGAALAHHFPRATGAKVNELPDSLLLDPPGEPPGEPPISAS